MSYPVTRTCSVTRFQDGIRATLDDAISEETPVLLSYNGAPHAVMLATPQDLEDFALGFSLSEGILQKPDELQALKIVEHPEGVEVALTIPAAREESLRGRERHLAGRTGCGLCGARTLEEAVRWPAPVSGGPAVKETALHKALDGLRPLQTINQKTGSVHAAAWVSPDGTIQLVREDVGRHNALDKLLGAMAKAETDPAAGFALITSRASYEMVQKAASRGITLLAAVSAPTALAVRMAEDAGLTLVGFLRPGSRVVYTHPRRLRAEEAP